MRIFSKVKSDRFAFNRLGIDLTIRLKNGALAEEVIGYNPLRKIFFKEAEAIRIYILENLDKGFIEPLDAPWVSPILIAKKPDGELRFYIDYYKVNIVIEKDRYLLFLIDKIISRLSDTIVFIKIDMH